MFTDVARHCGQTSCLQGYQAVYARLGVRLEERGESFYNPMLPGLVQELLEQGIAEESEGAKVIFVKVIAKCVLSLFCSKSVRCVPEQEHIGNHAPKHMVPTHALDVHIAAVLTAPYHWCFWNCTLRCY